MLTRGDFLCSYCTQIGFYLMLKAKRLSVQNHPVIKRLVQFRSLLHQLETSGDGLKAEIDGLLARIHAKETIAEQDFVVVRAPPSKRMKLKILSEPSEPSPPPAEPKKKAKKTVEEKEDLTKDEQAALELYSAINKRKAKEEDESDSDEDEEEDATAAASGVAEAAPAGEDEPVGKRAINYQIAKNKGLTPHRPKEQRNPRVKHRMKFRQAKIRRKGAVREPRKELKRYDGEISGIKAGVIRSVKLK